MSSVEVSIAFGYLTLSEVRALKELAGTTKAFSTIVNIGSGSGTSGLCFAEARPLANRYTIDISPGGPLGGLENERNAFVGSSLPLPVQILGDSHKVGKNWKGSLIDLLFIDADHSCEGIGGDIEAWLPSMEDHGIVAFHDYGSPNWPCVAQTVNRVMVVYETLAHVDTVIAFRVRK